MLSACLGPAAPETLGGGTEAEPAVRAADERENYNKYAYSTDLMQSVKGQGKARTTRKITG